MKLKSLYHFLGGMTCALILIACAILFVFAGTIIESFTQSHRYASLFTYHNPLFGLLLWGFFINILFSATRRLPFQMKHIPFVITHIGLLMIFGGCLAKYYFGLQGMMHITEGRGTHTVYELGTYALLIQDKQDTKVAKYTLNEKMGQAFSYKDLKLQVMAITPHSKEHIETWIKGNQLMILGTGPMPVYEFSSKSKELIPSGKICFKPMSQIIWTIFGLRALETNIDQIITMLPHSSTTLAIIEDEHRDIHFIGFDIDGNLDIQRFENSHFESLIAYDQGFKGYTIKKELSQKDISNSVSSAQDQQIIAEQIHLSLANHEELQPPLEMMKQAAKIAGVDFVETLMAFLNRWDQSATWLYPITEVLSDHEILLFSSLNWKAIDSKDYYGSLWMTQLFDRLDPLLKEDIDLLKTLDRIKWPLLTQVKQAINAEKTSYESVTNQVFEAAALYHSSLDPNQINPILSESYLAKQQARILSAYLRKYHIHLKTLAPPNNTRSKNQDIFTIETPLSPVVEEAAPQKKLEENCPLLHLTLKKGKHTETMKLSYDVSGQGLRWPVFFGEYLMRFQPNFTEIPYHVRLRQARQINYANSSQAFSFESDLLITDRRNGEVTETTISMNRVYETWDGYRFYLSSMTPANESTIKKVQLAVNYDPGKYYLTYIGAFLLSFGTIALFAKHSFLKFLY